MKESSLYPYVEEFLKSEAFKCFKARKRAGTKFVGNADVIGARDIGGDIRGDIEVVAVEVKTTPSNFGKILGQALGYSLFAHKCYLAIPFPDDKSFSIEQKELATRLGVGLLEMKKLDSGWQCREILTSANHTPYGHQIETLVRRGLDLVRCSFCGVFTDYSNHSENWKKALDKDMTYEEMRETGRRLLFSSRKKGDWRRIFICKDCVKTLWEGLQTAQ